MKKLQFKDMTVLWKTGIYERSTLNMAALPWTQPWIKPTDEGTQEVDFKVCLAAYQSIAFFMRINASVLR